MTPYESALHRWRSLTGLKKRGTRPVERAVDIAAFQLCRDMRETTGGPQYGLVAQLMVSGGLLVRGVRYQDSRQAVINRTKKAGVGENWPYWTKLWA